MTTDRELLEAAALAAGMGPLIWGEFNPETPLVYGAAIRWNPLTDDGDALRLAVKLGLSVHVLPAMNLSWASFNGGHTTYNADHDTDPYAATRRAIVRAAAGITQR